jgi:hypothetical protein
MRLRWSGVAVSVGTPIAYPLDAAGDKVGRAKEFVAFYEINIDCLTIITE